MEQQINFLCWQTILGSLGLAVYVVQKIMRHVEGHTCSQHTILMQNCLEGDVWVS